MKNYVKEFAQDIINDSHRLMTEMSKSCPVKGTFMNAVLQNKVQKWKELLRIILKD